MPRKDGKDGFIGLQGMVFSRNKKKSRFEDVVCRLMGVNEEVTEQTPALRGSDTKMLSAGSRRGRQTEP